MARRTKTGGRKKGTPNRLTFQTRLVLLSALQGEIEQIPKTMQSMEPKDRLEILIKLMPYLVPKVLPAHALEADGEGLRESDELAEALQEQNADERIREKMFRPLPF